MTGESERRDRIRLLNHLAEPGAYGVVSPLGCGRIALYRERGGASLGAGYVTAQAAAALVGEGGAVWRAEGRRTRLVLADRAATQADPVTSPPPAPWTVTFISLSCCA